MELAQLTHNYKYHRQYGHGNLNSENNPAERKQGEQQKNIDIKGQEFALVFRIKACAEFFPHNPYSPTARLSAKFQKRNSFGWILFHVWRIIVRNLILSSGFRFAAPVTHFDERKFLKRFSPKFVHCDLCIYRFVVYASIFLFCRLSLRKNLTLQIRHVNAVDTYLNFKELFSKCLDWLREKMVQLTVSQFFIYFFFFAKSLIARFSRLRKRLHRLHKHSKMHLIT